MPTDNQDHGARGRPMNELGPSGLLWLINRSVFHPRGLALALYTDEEATQVLGWDLVRAADGEPFQFPDDVDRSGFQRAEATLRASLNPEEVTRG